MATQTTHYDMTKQQSPEHVSVGLLNDNFDIIDGVMFANQEKSEQLADDYNASETYNTGDYVRRENYLYKCNTDNTTGTWDGTKWDRVKVMDEITQGGGGGGSSTLAGLDDVSLASPTDGQLLGYNGTSHKWENVNGGGGGSSTFAGLNDVNVQGVSNGDIARYNSTTGKWTDSSDLSDLELTVAQLQASVLSITDGHTILDSNGTAMAQEDGLQFASGCVEDDAVNGKTVYIEMIRISQANYDTLKANGQLKPGAKYFIYDAQPVAVNASNLPYSSTQSTKQKIDEKVDASSLSTVATSGSYNDLSDRPITPVAAQLRFHIETLGEDVLSVAKNMPEGIRVYANSNNPTNQPSGCSWGGYVFMKAQTKCNIIYMDSAHIAVANSVGSTTTSINWHIV